MPASIQNASPGAVSVLPYSLCSAFARNHEWHVAEVEYANGESERRSLTTTPRRSWSLSKRLTAAELTALRNFVIARKGVEPFYFYDGTETNPKWSWDASGATTQGRYTVVVQAPSWSQSLNMARHDASGIELVEVT